MSNSQTPPPTINGYLLYDGNCGICAKFVLAFNPIFRHYGFGIAPLRSEWIKAKIPLTTEELEKEIRLLHPDGSYSSGPEAYRQVFKKIWWLLPIYYLSRMPILSHAFNATYRFIAANRYRISKSCGI